MKEAEIQGWVEKNAEGLMGMVPTPEEASHLAMCMHHIQRWYYEDYPIGDFLSAIVRNDFTEACFRADDTNQKYLYLYAMFLANKVPFDWRKKAKEVNNAR